MVSGGAVAGQGREESIISLSNGVTGGATGPADDHHRPPGSATSRPHAGPAGSESHGSGHLLPSGASK